jgi:hypothetical protein
MKVGVYLFAILAVGALSTNVVVAGHRGHRGGGATLRTYF